MSNPFVLDYSIKDNFEFHEIVKNDIQKNKIRFEFPDGFAKIPIIEECRAVSEYGNPEQFDLLYDIVMQLLVGKTVVIKLLNASGNYYTLCQFIVTNKFMDLRGVPELNEFPIIVMWMVDLVVCSLSKISSSFTKRSGGGTRKIKRWVLRRRENLRKTKM